MAYLKSMIWGVLIGLTASLIFAAGFFLRDFLQVSQPFTVFSRSNENSFILLTEVQQILDRVYLREQPSYTQRQYGAVRGLLQTMGDKNTFFIEPVVAQSEAQVLAGTYGGIGVQLKRNAQGDVVLFPFADSPAQRAGIQDNDVLVAIDGRTVQLGDTQDFLDQALRGEVKPNNGVTVTIQRGEELQTLFIEFAVINVPSVIWYRTEEDPTIGYIHIMRFTNRTPSELDEALAQLEAQGVGALILDLRNNSGGLLQESIDVAARFVTQEVIAYERSRDQEKTHTNHVVPSSFSRQIPMVVLVNERTASASEIVAGAIRDSGRAVLIGQKTYGKGTVQQIFDLSDGSSIHVTSAEWLTPNHSTIEGVGLEPDIVMIPNASADVEFAEAVHYLQSLKSGN